MRRVILAIVGTVTGLVLLLSFKTQGTGSLSSPPAAISDGTAGTTGTGTTGSAGSSTVTGDSASTRFGPVQVQITITNGKVTAATALTYPTSNSRDRQINAYAIPVLNKEAVAAAGAHIDMVSGATYTSEGYATSLQSALDKAGLT